MKIFCSALFKSHFCSFMVAAICFCATASLLLFTTSTSAHRCIHDEEIIPFLTKNPPQTLPQYYPSGTLKHGSHGPPINVNVKTSSDGKIEYKEYSINVHHHHHHDNREGQAQGNSNAANSTNSGSIRFTVSTLDLYNTSQYCTKLGEFKPSFKGNMLNCSTPGSIFTDAKRDALVNELIPLALANISRLLHVVPLALPIVGITAGLCSPFTIPQSHIDSGVGNTDFILYVAAGPTPQDNVAWAGMCANDQTGRPIVGRMNCGPDYIKHDTTDEIQKYIATVTHELFHAMGFSSDAFINNYNIAGYTGPSVVTGPVSVRGGAQVSVITSPRAVEAARRFYGCPSAVGVELEPQGGAGTALSHPARRNLYESIMSGVQGDINRVENLTLSIFADMQYYFPIQSLAEPMYYGNQTGCPFLTEPCNSTTMSMKAQELFCATRTSADTLCTYNLHGIGKCALGQYDASLLESYYQYYKSVPGLAGTSALMQYCPFVDMYSNNKCRLGNLSTGDATSRILGHTFGDGGRCVQASTLIESGFNAPTGVPDRCLLVKCLRQQSPSGLKYKIQITVRASASIACPDDGSSGTVAAPTGFSGSLVCPSAYDICPRESKGWGSDLVYEDLPPITTTTLTTYYYDVNGSTYTLATSSTSTTTTTTTTTATTIPPSTTMSTATTTTPTTTTDPYIQIFTITLGNAVKNDQVVSAALNLRSSLISALGQDISRTVPSINITGVAKVGASNQLQVTVRISNPAQLSAFSSLIGDGNTAFLTNTASLLAQASGDTNIGTASLTLGSATIAVSTPAPTTGAPSNSTGSTSAICFISGQECYISYIAIAAGVLVIILVVVFVTKKKGNDNNNNNNAGRQGRGREASDTQKWNEEYGMRNAPANNRHADAPLQNMDREMQMHNQYQQQQLQRRPPQPSYYDL